MRYRNYGKSNNSFGSYLTNEMHQSMKKQNNKQTTKQSTNDDEDDKSKNILFMVCALGLIMLVVLMGGID